MGHGQINGGKRGVVLSGRLFHSAADREIRSRHVILPRRNDVGLATRLAAREEIQEAHKDRMMELCDVESSLSFLVVCCMRGPVLSHQVGPGSGNHGPKVWIGFQERVRTSGDRPGRLKLLVAATFVGCYAKAVWTILPLFLDAVRQLAVETVHSADGGWYGETFLKEAAVKAMVGQAGAMSPCGPDG
ncbi:hypothetical protein BKA66DRAFT_444387 [Pyrenochaeta sp. MPI-SDFR-AT-0127]|nr:hypothetical protein BKA66DRAFT_444387 [Pyrenochaeta sp. MPI-SDFR-AT-0127]